MNHAIEIKNFSYNYHDGVKALEDIDLTIAPSSKVALIGPNGAGKSTLLLAISMFIKGTGTIKIAGIEAINENKRKIRTKITSVLQNPDEQLFMPTLFDDIAFGPMNLGLSEDEITQRTMQALKTVGLEGMETRPPHHLSAGQKRSAAIATVLSMNPEIITMDEPDTSLDPRSRNALVELLRSLPQTLLIATCNMDFAASTCDTAVLMNKGKITTTGPAKEIMSDKTLMKSHGLEVPHNLKTTQ